MKRVRVIVETESSHMQRIVQYCERKRRTRRIEDCESDGRETIEEWGADR